MKRARERARFTLTKAARSANLVFSRRVGFGREEPRGRRGEGWKQRARGRVSNTAFDPGARNRDSQSRTRRVRARRRVCGKRPRKEGVLGVKLETGPKATKRSTVELTEVCTSDRNTREGNLF